MPNGITPDELDRWRHDHEQRTDRIHGEQDSRITRVAAESVPLNVYQSDQRATVEMARRLERDHVEDMRKLREDVINPALGRIDSLEQANANRPTMTFGRWVAVLTLAATFLGVLVTVWATSKGAK